MSNNVLSADNPLRMGIVGHGFVGQAVEYGFTHPFVQHVLIDPKYNTTVDMLKEFDPYVVFVCVPTPMSDDGHVDSSIVEDTVKSVAELTNALIIVKSTVTPQVIDNIYAILGEKDAIRFVYNPEFLTEKSAKADFVSAKFHVIGGTRDAQMATADLYSNFSNCESEDYHFMSAFEASFVKYTINSFLATKVTFFNQLYDLINMWGCNYNKIIRAAGKDERVGIGQTRVPGFDGKRGFGGACLPKDTSALLKFSTMENADGDEISFDLLEKVLDINARYRSMYELDDREKVNNITFVDFRGGKNGRDGQTQEKLED